jgi:type II secretory pathway pseudopilin PulG
MDENLVGYLLKSLDPDEQHAVEAHLETHPDARAKLDLLERALAPLGADAEEPEPTPGLALMTLARVAEHKCRPLPPAPQPPRSQLAPSGWPRFRRADVLAAAALLVIVGGVALPILAQARQQRDRVACANNLRTFWGALQEYSDQHDRAFPMIEQQGARSVAGAFVPILRDAGTVGNTMLVSCPARPTQTELTGSSLVDLQAAYDQGEEEFSRLARDLAGGYAYTLGYRNGATLVGLTADDPDTLPILADVPAGIGNSLNHGGAGQNVLYIGGDVRWCNLRTVGEDLDDIYVNKQNLLLAGVNHSDTVLGPGDARPSGTPAQK